MVNTEIFDREIIRQGFGQPVDLRSDAQAAKGYRYLRTVLETLVIDTRKGLPELPEISFGFIRDNQVNALTFKSRGKYFIAITTGTVFLLELVTMRMLSDSHFFDHIGVPRDEADDLPPLNDFCLNADAMFNLGYRAKRPKTKVRHRYAVHLLEQAMLFLFGRGRSHHTRPCRLPR